MLLALPAFFMPVLALVAAILMIVINASCNTILQTVSDEDKGEGNKFLHYGVYGRLPMGSLAVGYICI